MTFFNSFLCFFLALLYCSPQSCKVLQEELTSDSCSPPRFALNGSNSEKGEVKVKNEYMHIKEVKFSGSIGPLGEKRLCKIKCIGGQWVGPLCLDQQGFKFSINYFRKV